MLRFANVEFLWALVLVPLIVFFFLYTRAWKKKALASFGDKAIVNQIMPDVSLSRPSFKFVLFIIAFSLLIIGLADPQIGSKMEEVKRTGSEIMVLLDVSNSMLAEDLSPNRLENAKRSIALLIDNLHNDKVGIIVFAGQAYVQLPVTTDYAAAKLFLNTINTNMVPTQGTAIGAAINMGVRSFDFKNGIAKAMVVITDGENHEDDAVAAAKSAQDKDVILHVLGVGSTQGAPLPIYNNGKQVGFRTDSAGQTIVTKLNEEMCREIAEAGGGAYVRATNANGGLGIIKSEIDRMQKKAYGGKMFKDFEDRFQFFLGLAFLLLVAEFFVSNRRSSRFGNLKLFEVKKT